VTALAWATRCRTSCSRTCSCVINSPSSPARLAPAGGLDFQRPQGLATSPHLRAIGQQINARLLDLEQAADGATSGPSLVDRLPRPTASPTGQRGSALRFGDPRVQALFGALCRFSHLPTASATATCGRSCLACSVATWPATRRVR
jgi:hypothetical protein